MAVGLLDVALGEAEVTAHHVHRGVAKDLLEGVGVAVVAQEGDGEGVSKSVRVTMGDAGAVADPAEETNQVVAAHGAARGGEEHAVGVVLRRGASGEVTPD